MITFVFSRIPDLEPEDYILNEEVLSAREKVEFLGLKVSKRRREWAASRLALKKLARRVIPGLEGMELDAVEVLKEPSGAPYLVLNGIRLGVSVSLSHSNGFVMAACSPQGIGFGVDLELVEPRGVEFLGDFFTPGEIRQVRGAGAKGDEVTTIFWSAKEALLKAASTGLKVDTRKINLTLGPHAIDENTWNTLGVDCPEIISPSPHLVWHKEGLMIQTVCQVGETSLEISEVTLD